jgi:signal transduction histidine kinase
MSGVGERRVPALTRTRGENGGDIATAALAQGADIDVTRPPNPAVLVAIAVVGLATTAYTVALGLTNSDVSRVQVVLLHWISIPYIAAGLVAWWRRPDSRLGALMVAGGFATGVSALQFARLDLPYTLGAAFDVLPAAFFLHVYLAFPDGHLRSRFERVLVGAAYAAAIGLQLVKMSLGVFGPHNLLELSSRPAAAQTVGQVQLVSLAALCLAGIGVLAARRRRAGWPRRRPLTLLIDSFALCLVMIALLFVVGSFQILSAAFLAIQRATLGVLGISPVAFLIGLLRIRLARSAVGDLFVELRGDPAPANLRDALARALRDPSLTLAFWLPQFGCWADLEGRPVDLAANDDGRATTRIDLGGEHIAALLHDPALLDEPALLDAVTAAAGIALDNARLHAELRARQEELKGSRARVIEAGERERQRLERDLHDGAQQRLVALSLELGLLEEKLEADSDTRARLDQARREIGTSLEELRAVARGIHPAVVSGHGLAVALESLAARAPVPVRLTVEIEDRLPERLEVAAFYLVSESLANIGKHAQATSAFVEVAHTNGQVVVEVVDDGVGGADTERGTGLRGLADRVEALEGRLRVWSPEGRGTRLRAEIPCAS